MLRATAISALCMALAPEVAAFAPPATLPTEAGRANRGPMALGAVCSAGAPGRREFIRGALAVGGAAILRGPAAFAEDDDGEHFNPHTVVLVLISSLFEGVLIDGEDRLCSVQARTGCARFKQLVMRDTCSLFFAPDTLRCMPAEDQDKPASVPRKVTYAVKDDVCEKHPTWKQCKKKISDGAALNPNAPEITLSSGLKVKELVAGKGNTPRPGDACTVHYSLFYNGDEIESSRESSGLAASPIGFQYGVTEGYGSVIPAIALGIEDMKVGGIRRITAPPNMAFGKKGRQGGRVPPDATVQFDVQLLSVKRSGTNPVSSQGRGSEKNTGLFDLF